MPLDDSEPTDSPPTLPAPDASAAPTRRKGRVPVRAVTLWLLGLFITVALAVIAAWGGLLLAIFGLAGVSLVVAVVMLAVAATVWRRALLPVAVIVCALTLATAAQALQAVRYKREIGTSIVTPRTPSDIPRGGYHHGVGPMLIDLRQFHADNGSTTAISAQADQGQLVVALPRGRCFNLVVTGSATYVPQGGMADQALRFAGVRSIDGATSYGSMGLTDAAYQRSVSTDPNGGAPSPQTWFPLLAFGVQPTMASGRWSRKAAGEPDAPTLQLHLTATTQIVVRDYPDWIGPLDGTIEYDQQDGLAWPSAVQPPRSPGQLRWADRASVRTPANRARWIAWEREMIVWAKAQSARYAGRCASQAALRDRGQTFITQPAAIRGTSGHVTTIDGRAADRRSPIPQSPVKPGQLLSVEVDGLGQIRTQPTATGATA